MTHDRQRLERRIVLRGMTTIFFAQIYPLRRMQRRGQAMEDNQIKAAVKEQYGKVATGEATCGSLCGCTENAEGLAITFGYSAG